MQVNNGSVRILLTPSPRAWYLSETHMWLYNFQARFVPKILSREQAHTIRAVRANPDQPGNTLHLYTGLRHKGAKLLMRVPCVKLEEISIDSRDGSPNH